jgi:hypothetical protein
VTGSKTPANSMVLQMRMKELSMWIRFARTNYKLPRNEEFIEDADIVHLKSIFEEKLWDGLFPIISLTLKTQYGDTLVSLLTKSLIQMIVISGSFSDLHFQHEASLNGLISLSGLAKEYYPPYAAKCSLRRRCLYRST